MVYLISYDLINKPIQKYNEVISSIKILGESIRILESTWLVDTNLGTVQEVLSVISQLFESEDHFLVLQLNSDNKFDGKLADMKNTWINQHL